MGGVLVREEDGSARFFRLASTTLVGRAWACSVRVTGSKAPQYWLDIRWNGRIWTWRPLSKREETQGQGALLPQDSEWRELKGSEGNKSFRIKLGSTVTIELIDAAPPDRFAVDLADDQQLDEQALSEYIAWSAGADGTVSHYLLDDETHAPIPDGGVVVTPPTGTHPSRPLRVHLPSLAIATTHDARRLSLDVPINVEVWLKQMRATITQGSHLTANLVGAEVRTLAVYAVARHDDVPRGGWLTRDDAFEEWCACGGPRTSPRDRITWERGKLRAQLSAAGVIGAERLMPTRNLGPGAQVHLGPPVESVDLYEAEAEADDP
jgi:hypothetical protein